MKGVFSYNENTFLKLDTLTTRSNAQYASKLMLIQDTLLFVGYGASEIATFTQKEYFLNVASLARYSPYLFANYVKNQKITLTKEASESDATYSGELGHVPFSIRIDKETSLINEIDVLSYDPLYGDVETAYLYQDYDTKSSHPFPQQVIVKNISGHVIDSLAISQAASGLNSDLIGKPDKYEFAGEPEETSKEVVVQKYNDYLHLIELKHEDDRVMVVEFDDYMLVADAPINSENGELIIEEVRKIAPFKPIKYFAVGHHHPHYIGGIRAFVHKGATVLSSDANEEYVRFITGASHKLQPDSLEMEPKKLLYQPVQDSLSLDNGVKMTIYFIGDQSAHAEDFLIFHFPEDKILFQDELCWIPEKGEITPASGRQKGLYNSIVALNLDVETIIQSWPIQNYGVASIIPFEDLEKSIDLVTEN